MATSEEYTPMILNAELSNSDLELESNQHSAQPSSLAPWTRHALALSLVSALVLGAMAVGSMRARAAVVAQLQPIGLDVVNPGAPMITAPPPVTTNGNPCVPMTTAPPPVTTNGNPCAVAPAPLAPVPQVAQPVPSSSLCSSTIVQEVCGLVNGKTAEYWGTAADTDPTILHAKEIADHLSTDEVSVKKFLNLITATNVEVAGPAGAFGVKCQELCEKAVAQLPAKWHPPKHDVGCFFTSRQYDTPVCDIDLSPAELTKVKIPGSSDPAKATEDLGENGPKHKLSTEEHALNDLLATPYALMNTEQKDKWWKLAHRPTNTYEMRNSILQMFRIYPPQKIAFIDEEVTTAAGRRLATPSDTCSYAKDGTCDEAWGPGGIAYCLDGTDCTDCGKCTAVTVPASPPTPPQCTGGGYYCKFPFTHLGKSYSTCTKGGNPLGSPWCAIATSGSNKQMQKWKFCKCETGCCGQAPPSTPPWSPPPPAPVSQPPVSTVPQWKQMAIRNGIKAQAFIMTTLNKMGARSIGQKVIEYYGNNNYYTRAEIKRNLNGVRTLLNNVEYVRQPNGGTCVKTTVAYVMHWGKVSQRTCGDRCQTGAYVINLCDHYFKVSQFTRIGTIIHEGAHHMSMSLRDVKFTYLGKWQTAYGQPICRSMAKHCRAGSASSCTKCLRNADSLEYLAESVNKAR